MKGESGGFQYQWPSDWPKLLASKLSGSPELIKVRLSLKYCQDILNYTLINSKIQLKRILKRNETRWE
jgi:hypothetical protein